MVDNGNTIRIEPVTTERNLYLVGRLRYALTVQEMGLNMHHADHVRQVVLEPLDYTGHVLAAWEGEMPVGTVRANLLSRCDIGAYRNAYAIDRFPPECVANMSITTRMAIDSKHRQGGLFVRLAVAMYQYYLLEGITHDVVDCRKRLVPLFLRLGYKVHEPNFAHPEFGDVTVLALELRDADHLQAVQSPFLTSLETWQRQQSSTLPYRLCENSMKRAECS